jgi:hypothetical protein
MTSSAYVLSAVIIHHSGGAHCPSNLKEETTNSAATHWPRDSVNFAKFPPPAILRLWPSCEMIARQYARWRRRISLRDGAPGDRASGASGGLHTFARNQRIIERAHGDLARKPKGWLEYEPGHAAETREV